VPLVLQRRSTTFYQIIENSISSFTASSTDTLTNKTLDSSTNTIHADSTHVQVRNSSGSTITKGSPVYISGFDVGTTSPEISLADSSVAGTMPCVGLVSADITNNSTGLVIASGQLTDLNTSTYTIGDTLYVSETTGTLTATKPTGTALIQNIAIVERVHSSNGVVHISAINRTNDLPNIPDGKIWIGNASAVPTGVTLSGDVTVTNAGVTTVGTLNQNTTGTASNVTGTVAVANGGTGSTTASAARTALGVAIGSDVQAYNSATALTTNKISDFAATTSAELAGTISDETGSGALVFGTSPTLVTPALGTPASGILSGCTVIPMAQASGILPDANMPNLTGDITTVEGAVATTIGADKVLLSMVAPAAKTEALIMAVSDETTALTAGTSAGVFRMPYGFTLTAVRASVTTAGTGSVITVDINESATTILSTKLTIDATEKTSTTAATAAVISDSALADDSEITIDIDTVDSGGVGAGLKIYLIGYQT
jgi:hypothetical protein